MIARKIKQLQRRNWPKNWQFLLYISQRVTSLRVSTLHATYLTPALVNRRILHYVSYWLQYTGPHRYGLWWWTLETNFLSHKTEHNVIEHEQEFVRNPLAKTLSITVNGTILTHILTTNRLTKLPSAQDWTPRPRTVAYVRPQAPQQQVTLTCRRKPKRLYIPFRSL